MNKIIMGIDGGGTYTRVLITNQEGTILSHIKHEGGASYHKNPNAINDVQEAMKKALNEAHLKAEDIDVVVSGIAGYDKKEDLEWVSQLTAIENLKADVISLNDSKIAHSASLLGKSGIICIAGTGSIILGLNEQGEYRRNYDYYHNAYGASRLLTYNLMHHVLANKQDDTDQKLIEALYNHFNVENQEAFSELAFNGFNENSQARDKQFGDFTKHITKEAMNGSHLAMKICDQVVDQIILGFEIVASSFKSNKIPVGLIGSVVNSDYIYTKITEKLPTRFYLENSDLSPEIGAILIGMKHLNIDLSDNIIKHLQEGKD